MLLSKYNALMYKLTCYRKPYSLQLLSPFVFTLIIQEGHRSFWTERFPSVSLSFFFFVWLFLRLHCEHFVYSGGYMQNFASQCGLFIARCSLYQSRSFQCVTASSSNSFADSPFTPPLSLLPCAWLGGVCRGVGLVLGVRLLNGIRPQASPSSTPIA